jgi:methyl-accepting chemotaxis protein
MKSIKRQLISIIVLVALIPLLISAAAFSFYMTNDTTKLVEKNNLIVTQSIADNVSGFIEKAYSLTEEMANNPVVRAYNPEGQKQILVSNAERNKYFDLLYIQDIKGDQTARSKGELGNRANRWWFTEMMNKQNPFVSKSYYSVANNSTVTSIFFPTYDKDSKLTGIFGADLMLDHLQGLVDKYNVGKDSYICIVDSEGVVIAHPEKEQVAELYNYKTLKKTILEKDAKGNVLKDEKGNEKTKEVDIAVAKDFKDIIEKALSGKSGTLEFKNIDNKATICTYSPIKLPGDSKDWAVITVQAKSAALSSIYAVLVKTLTISGIIVMLIVIITFIIGNKVSEPLIYLNNIIKDAASGDLTVESNLKSKNELGALSSSFNVMLLNTKSLIQHILQASKKVQASSENIVATAEESSASIDEVVSTITNIANNSKEQSDKMQLGLEEVKSLSSDIEAMAKYMDQSRELSNNTIKLSEVGINVMYKLDERSQNTIQSAADVTRIIEELSNKAIHISNIVGTISAISEQTNLLALNAAIEAARAGEAGRGFSVVAEEVRKLSVGTAESSREVKDIITEIQHDIGKAKESMRQTEVVISEQLDAVNDTKDSFSQITGAVNEIVNNIGEVNKKLNTILISKDGVLKVIDEAYGSSAEISQSAEEIVAITEQQAAVVNELTNLTLELNKLSGVLEENIRSFKVS